MLAEALLKNPVLEIVSESGTSFEIFQPRGGEEAVLEAGGISVLRVARTS